MRMFRFLRETLLQVLKFVPKKSEYLNKIAVKIKEKFKIADLLHNNIIRKLDMKSKKEEV